MPGASTSSNAVFGLAEPDDEGQTRLHGRDTECDTLSGLLRQVRRGRGAVLVLRGEPGSGKTALLDYASGLAGEDVRVVRAAGAESEAGLAYAGLHQLCAPLARPAGLAGLAGGLPAPQRTALETALGLRAGNAPDRLLVGLAVLGLLTEATAGTGGTTLICLVDDAQWLDAASRQALAFAARRLPAAPAGMIFATRTPVTDLDGLPELVIGGLPDADARALLAAAAPWPLDERVRDQFIAEAGGNPRRLLELRDLPPAELAGGFRLPPAPAPGGTVLERLGGLPPQTRRLLVTAAADPTGDPALLWRAAGLLGVSSEAALPAVEAGLVAFGGRVLFSSRPVRLAAYHCAPPRDRQAAHHALAQASDPRLDPDRRAWHQAAASTEPDEGIAGELERTADRAQARGGLIAAAAFLERAAALTPEPLRRADRILAAAAVMLPAGAPAAVTRLLTVAGPGLPGSQRQASADLVRARLADTARQRADAPGLLLDAARRLDQSDPAAVRAAYLEAIRAALFTAGLAAPGGTATEVARAARGAPCPDPAGLPDLLLDGLAAWLGGDREAVEASGRGERGGDATSAAQQLRWLPLACAAALARWDGAAASQLAARLVELARGEGALGDLPLALNLLACLRVLGGDLSGARALTAEAQRVAGVTGARAVPYGALALAALAGSGGSYGSGGAGSGGAGSALALIESAAAGAAARGEGLGAAAAHWASAVLHNGLGQYATALAAAQDAIRYGTAALACWPAAELIEAAARSGQPERAAAAMDCLSRAASAAGSDWALGIRARSQALLNSAAAAERDYQAAIEHLSRSPAPVALARAHLLYGEWLRRANRRVDARGQLHRAFQLLTAAGADGFAERARRELLATGETVRKRSGESNGSLTAQEMQVAVRARDGHTNTEIGAELFLSPRTVEWHLRKVFAKLDITSRRQLHRVLRGTVAAAPA